MTNQELAKKLGSLKNVAPDAKWLEGNRELLLAQISNSGATNLSVWKVVLINFSSFTRAAARPATAFVAFVLLLVMGGFFSERFFAQAKPNDSLYIARIISEQVKLNTTFNTEARDMLTVKYASEHAKDISAVLADPGFNKEENQARVEELSSNFKAEVETVKQGISRLAASTQAAESARAKINNDTGLEIMIAEEAKEEQGIQVQEGASSVSEVPVPEAVETPTATGSPATSTSDGVSSPVPIDGEVVAESSAVDKMLEEAKSLFDAKDYEKASQKLKEVDEIIKK